VVRGVRMMYTDWIGKKVEYIQGGNGDMGHHGFELSGTVLEYVSSGASMDEARIRHGFKKWDSRSQSVDRSIRADRFLIKLDPGHSGKYGTPYVGKCSLVNN